MASIRNLNFLFVVDGNANEATYHRYALRRLLEKVPDAVVTTFTDGDYRASGGRERVVNVREMFFDVYRCLVDEPRVGKFPWIVFARYLAPLYFTDPTFYMDNDCVVTNTAFLDELAKLPAVSPEEGGEVFAVTEPEYQRDCNWTSVASHVAGAASRMRVGAEGMDYYNSGVLYLPIQTHLERYREKCKLMYDLHRMFAFNLADQDAMNLVMNVRPLARTCNTAHYEETEAKTASIVHYNAAAGGKSKYKLLIQKEGIK